MKAQPVSYYIKTNRSFSFTRRYAWIITILIGVGGQFVPALGLLVPLIMAALIGTSLFKGKFWCGNFCPHGSLFDNVLQPISRHVKIPHFFGSKIVIALVLLFFMYNMANRFFNVYRAAEAWELYERLGFIFANTYLMVILAGGLLAVAVNSRAWCQFCPMGTMQRIFYKLGKALGLTKKTDEKVTIEHPELCHSCGKCARVCPMQLTPYLNFSENHQLEDDRCIRCYTCVKNCPAGILDIANETKRVMITSKASLEGFDKAKYYKAEIKRVRQLNDDIREYTFKLLEPEKMFFIPGQFVLVEIDKNHKMYRAYTISGSSEDYSEVKTTIKSLGDGYGTNLIFNNFKEGHQLTLKGPMGKELQVDEESSELLFLANGIGITPFVNTVEAFFVRKDYDFKGKATLIYGARYEEDLVYDDFFAAADEDNDNFVYKKILSRPRREDHEKGYVTDVIKKKDFSKETKVYICGTPQMAGDAIKLLTEKGVSKDNIHYEDFGV